MLDLRAIRHDPGAVRDALARRHSAAVLSDFDRAVELDLGVRELTAARDRARAEINEISKEVGALRRAGDVEGAERLQARSRELGSNEKNLAAQHGLAETSLREVLLGIPNVPHADAPDGTSDADNPVVTGPVGMPDEFAPHQCVPHWETGAALGILDAERAVKISGAMFNLQRGLGATLARALCQYALDCNADAFEEVRPPSLVTSATLTASGQLPKFADDAYHIANDDLWCIPTAEVPLTSLYGGEIVPEASLPIRMMAATPCYRREAGSAGRDTRGMLRVHEFDKVEILAVCTPEQAPALLDDMVARAEATIAGLGLAYRVIEICTGDLGQSHHRSLDIEVYAPGAEQWLEVSSVSWFSDYQARRADIRVRREPRDGEQQPKGTEIAHTLNGSALAVPRVWAAILEHCRQPDGSVLIPDVLHPYTRGATRISLPASS
ncbi:MAG: serine--tRNA ligase [Acidimicrobiia bacterium]|nr:serine--tRNA ligase [Acidimicrobiia bacterium]